MLESYPTSEGTPPNKNALTSPEYIIHEGKKCIATTAHSLQLSQPLPLFLLRKDRWHLLEILLPVLFLNSRDEPGLPGTEHIDRVAFVCAFDALFELYVERAGVETEPPGVGFVACESRAVDTGLLARAEADD